jgi:hypothetical protein
MEFFMKKSILASSIAAAVFGLGAVTGAQASSVLLVPYFSAQGANATLLNITNTDTINGKAVKVRFRGAANSDDVFDFQVFLSPTDVWTANISKGADGRAVMTTSDASCTKPAASVLNATPFLTSRLDPALSADDKANGTREGYVEIISMANIPPSQASVVAQFGGTSNLLQTANVAPAAATDVNPLFTATKHVKSVAPCSGTAFTNLDKDTAFAQSTSDYSSKLGMTPSTGGLIANWTIVNTVNAAAWGGEATPVPTTPTVVTYAPQTAGKVVNIANYTADPLFLSSVDAEKSNTVAITSAAVVAGMYDLPDLSTSVTGANNPGGTAAQAAAMTHALTKAKITNEFAVESAINGSTDWVFSMPTRRYHVAMAYNQIATGDDGRRFNKLLQTAGGNGYQVFLKADTSLVKGLICVNAQPITPYDREENTPVSTTDVVISPSTVAGTAKLCGETSVLSFNNGVGTSKALEASVAVTALDVGYAAGWATLDNVYPVIGGAFSRAAFGAQGFGIYRAHR